ncbi:MAG: hypothetical protein K2G30_01275 [Muribaculaceae bacterium]|nr:hypothetical protein [Muribaculaceae bacterium]MDE7141525.1 hypothetical protein [Muribaculaceae bacterium]
MKAPRTIALGALCALALASCGGRHDKVRPVVDALNSPEFRARELQTGLFSGSEARIDGDTLVFAVDCTEKVVIGDLPPRSRAFLEQSAAMELSALCSDQGFREGIEALRDERMGIKIVWRDTRGSEIAVALSPSGILGAD